MTNEEALIALRKDRPLQVINEVFFMKENPLGWLDVNVDMEAMLFGTLIRHVRITLPYPSAAYEKYLNLMEPPYENQHDVNDPLMPTEDLL